MLNQDVSILVPHATYQEEMDDCMDEWSRFLRPVGKLLARLFVWDQKLIASFDKVFIENISKLAYW